MSLEKHYGFVCQDKMGFFSHVSSSYPLDMLNSGIIILKVYNGDLREVSEKTQKHVERLRTYSPVSPSLELVANSTVTNTIPTIRLC